ncbi:Telomere repeat-binding protein 6 [Senna tora]|uniref:Telomere repeat-binding protein 6 n=1 Tax=Senna tora TaxID=362788 RepID=A0A834XDV3_9FABA|nr:Telomere repeat-binding protein 6 [Senna tora]
METVVVINDNEGRLEYSGADRSSSALSSPKQIANQVVYKLVRVEGDGRLVPATDDEVIEVEDFLEYDESEMHVVADSGQNVECLLVERSSLGKPQLECSEDLSKSNNEEADLWKLNAQLQEEKHDLVCGSPGHSYVNVDSQSFADKLPVIDGKIQAEIPSTEIASSRTSGGLIDSGSSALAVCSNLKPDFSLLKGEICLDKLSIRELHELFKVTFGRETTVKDKQWLKRRISMSLTNSCDVSTTSFIVEDNKLVKKSEENNCGNVDTVLSRDITAGGEYSNCKDLSNTEGSGIEDNLVVSGYVPKNHDTDHELGHEDLQTEQRAPKRMRKPTKRYIEEFSEYESRDHHPRLLNSNKSLGLGHISPKSCNKAARNVFSEGRTVITRLDSLGSSEIHIPCVSRVRRSRPRKNIMSLINFHTSGMREVEKLGYKALGEHASQAARGSQDEALKSTSTPAKFQQPVRPTVPLLIVSAAEPVKNKLGPVMGTVELQQELRPKKPDSSSYTLDDNLVTIPVAKGGMRRKHHRAWTLVEVMKLVEGVSRCGAGKWSEIKRLAFASYSHRTSVDLKDKWRNLLKASFAPMPADERVSEIPCPLPLHAALKSRSANIVPYFQYVHLFIPKLWFSLLHYHHSGVVSKVECSGLLVLVGFKFIQFLY